MKVFNFSINRFIDRDWGEVFMNKKTELEEKIIKFLTLAQKELIL